jgi:hypothetical protein
MDRGVTRILVLFALLLAFALPHPALAEPADIDAASRGVVRVIVVGEDGNQVFPISHGTGFAVSNERIVTNTHVIEEARKDERLSIGIVPSDGGEAVYARIVAFSPRNDLALLATTAPMRLPPLTIATNLDSGSGRVISVGYPMNVDRAQGLSEGDIFRTQPPVQSTGFLSGRRPSREFDTILHTAPIARGSSGGPLLDECGRVIGVNSFGAESGNADAEFFFAVSTRELLPFLRDNGVRVRTNGLPCRSLAELDEEERERAETEAEAQTAATQAEAAELTQQRAEMRREIEFDVLDERDNRFVFALLLIMIAGFAGAFGWLAYEREENRPMKIALGIAALAMVGAIVAWLSRPGLPEVEERLAQRMAASQQNEEVQPGNGGPSGVITLPDRGEQLICVIDTQRSRITGAQPEDLPLEWEEGGCVNGRAQYGLASGEWSRVFVPATEEVVTVNRYDPEAREYRIDRYLLGREEMIAARKVRGEYQAPGCNGGEETALKLGSDQAALLAMLPSQPNERLVYKCTEKPDE